MLILCDIDSTVNDHWRRIRKWTIPKWPGKSIDKRAFTRDEVLKDVPLPGSVEANHLFSEHDLRFLSARDFDDAYDITKCWLDSNGFRYNEIKIVNSVYDKIEYIRSTRPDLIVDDFSTKHQNHGPYECLYHDVIEQLRDEMYVHEVFKGDWQTLVDRYIVRGFVDMETKILRDKYIDLYSTANSPYIINASDQHFNRAKQFILSLDIKSVCDIGTGCGHFCLWAAANGKHAYGTDIASVAAGAVIPGDRVTYLDAYATAIPLPDKWVDLVTSFDVFEHCREQDIDAILSESKRVAKIGLFKVSFRQAYEKFLDGTDLHLTVNDKQWWFNKMSYFGTVTVLDGDYFLVHFI